MKINKENLRASKLTIELCLDIFFISKNILNFLNIKLKFFIII